MENHVTTERRVITTSHVRALLALVVATLVGIGLVGTTPRPAAALPPETFFAEAVPQAQAGEAEFGVPTSVALAQAALESGWGESSLTRDGNAYFGITCGTDRGPIATGCVRKVTQECDTNGCHDEVALFRSYANRTDSFRDHGHFLRNNARYAAAFAYTGDPDQFIREVHAAGYATDPEYADKIIAMMQQYNLYQYNAGGGGGSTPSRPTIQAGDAGAAVTEAQNLLISRGYAIDADGIFGPATEAAVRQFQTTEGLQSDGIVGPATWGALLR